MGFPAAPASRGTRGPQPFPSPPEPAAERRTIPLWPLQSSSCSPHKRAAVRSQAGPAIQWTGSGIRTWTSSGSAGLPTRSLNLLTCCGSGHSTLHVHALRAHLTTSECPQPALRADREQVLKPASGASPHLQTPDGAPHTEPRASLLQRSQPSQRPAQERPQQHHPTEPTSRNRPLWPTSHRGPPPRRDATQRCERAEHRNRARHDEP